MARVLGSYLCGVMCPFPGNPMRTAERGGWSSGELGTGRNQVSKHSEL